MKKILAVLLAALVVLSCFSVMAFAAEESVDPSFAWSYTILEYIRDVLKPIINLIYSLIGGYIPMPLA